MGWTWYGGDCDGRLVLPCAAVSASALFGGIATHRDERRGGGQNSMEGVINRWIGCERADGEGDAIGTAVGG